MLNSFMNKNKLLSLIIAVVTPFVGIMLYALVKQIPIGAISIPCSGYNDEFFYYKQIEGMVHYGIPQGYFGYNESHALYGNLGGWSIVMLYTFVLFGRIFGWTYTTPIIINIALWVIAFVVVFVALRPTITQQLFISLSWILYAINIRYIFSAAPETLITVLFLIFSVSVYRVSKDNDNIWLAIADICLVLLTLMRGYYLLFVIVVLAAIYKHNRKIDFRLLIQCAIALFAAIGFVLIVHYTFAAYFTSDFNTAWITNPKLFIKNNLLGFLETCRYMGEALMMKNIRGSWYLLYFLMLPYIIYKCIKSKDIVSISLLTSWIILIVAMWTMYRIEESCRHIMACTIVFAMLIGYLESKSIIMVIVSIVLIYSTWLCKDDGMYNNIPIENHAQIEAINDGLMKMSESMELTNNAWDNTVIWTRSAQFNDLYAVPKGFGINCCIDDYVYNNFENVNSKYIAARLDSEMDAFLEDKCEKVTEYGSTVIYKTR